MSDEILRVSKFLSLVLRHKPELIGLTLDQNGWASVEDLIRLANRHGIRLTRPLLMQVVADNEKKRFALSDNGERIRASQGHSVKVDLGLPPALPPEILYHGTASRFLESILAGGLHSANRQHVHLSPDVATAMRVGQRHGSPVVLVIRSGEMAAAGHTFFVSANGVWLTDRVPQEFISVAAR
jgi:putative RNA 2'-phosphotransferase